MTAKESWKNDKTNLIEKLFKTACNVPEIEAYLKKEISYLERVIPFGASVIDFGCGNGRHLKILESNITKGLGLDMNQDYLDEANSFNSNKLRFEKGDITTYSSIEKFDIAICMYNTFGNVEENKKLLNSMIKVIKSNGKIIISVFGKASIPSRIEMYRLLGFNHITINEHQIIMEDEGFVSQHFSKKELIELIPNATVEKCTDIGWIVTFCK